MVGWHQRLDGHESEQSPGVGDEQGSLACCSPQGHRVRRDLVTEQQQRTFFTEIHTHTYTHTHTHIYTQTHAHIHTHTYI